MRRLISVIVVLACLVSACAPTDVPTAMPSGSPSGSPTATPTSVAPGSGTPTPTSTLRAATWARQSTGGDVPEARSGHSWTADPSDAAAYLVGGLVGGVPVMDVWRYDLGADLWEARELTDSAPAPRSGHAAIWRDDLGVVIVGGSGADGTTLSDLWTYDPRSDAWREVPAAGDGPPARTAACAAVGPDDRIWIDGGRAADGTPLPDRWIVDPLTGTWTPVETTGAGPAARAGHVCWWTLEGRFIVAGGSTADGVLGDVWSLGGAEDGSVGPALTWTELSTGAAAGARSDAAWSRASDRMVVVGGRDAAGNALADVVAYDTGSATSEAFGSSGEAPAARIAGALIDDPGGERSLLFGGLVGAVASDELWRLELP